MTLSRTVWLGALALMIGCVEESVEPSIEYFAITPDVAQAGATVRAEIEIVGVHTHGHDHSHEGGHSHHHGDGTGPHVHLFVDDVESPSFATMSGSRVDVQLPHDLEPGEYTIIALVHDHGDDAFELTAEADLLIVR